MHISEGVLSPGVLIAGAALTTAGVAVGLKNLDHEEIPSIGILSAAFFVASLVHVPVGPASAHLILNGLLGLILGWKAFPAILIALFLQALLFHHGGVTTIGINTLIMGVPALLAYAIFKAASGKGILRKGISEGIIGALAGGTAVILGTLLLALTLFSAGEAFTAVAELVAVSHIPIIIIEAVLTGAVLSFLAKVKPVAIVIYGAGFSPHLIHLVDNYRSETILGQDRTAYYSSIP